MFSISFDVVYDTRINCMGGTVVQAVAPTTFGIDAHGGHGFESGPMSFLLSTPHLFSLSFPVPLFTDLSIKGIKAPKKKKKKKLIQKANSSP